MKHSRIFLLIVTILVAGGWHTAAQEAEKDTTAVEEKQAQEEESPPEPAASGTVQQDSSAGVKEGEIQEAETVPAGEVINNVKEVYAGLDSYIVEFGLSQEDKPKKEITDERIEQLKSIYRLLYRDDTPGEAGYFMRLEGLTGLNRRTIVVYYPGDDGEYVYRIYKPALPKGQVVNPDDPRVDDVENVTFAYITGEMEQLARAQGSVVTAARYSDRYELEIIVDKEYSSHDVKRHRITYCFDLENYHLISRRTEVEKKKDSDNFLFISQITWKDFKPGATPSVEEITAVPEFNEE